jgi:hypothetical protein
MAECSAFSKSTIKLSESKSGQCDFKMSRAVEYDKHVLSSIRKYINGTQVFPTKPLIIQI